MSESESKVQKHFANEHFRIFNSGERMWRIGRESNVYTKKRVSHAVHLQTNLAPPVVRIVTPDCVKTLN